MSDVICPDCGANYDSELIASLASFPCAGCGGTLAGGLADAAAPEAVAPPPAARVGRPRRAASARKPKSGTPKAVIAGGALCVVAGVVAFVATSPGGGPSRPTPARAAEPRSDATKDAAAPPPPAPAPRPPAPPVDVAAEADACIAECEQADEANDASLVALRAERARHPGTPWWADEAETKRIRGLVAETRAAEARLRDPYHAGVARWVRRHRAVDIMKDYPALHAAVGPYVIFVSLNVARDPTAPPEREVSMADVSDTERARGAKVLERNVAVFSALYEGWMTEIAPHFGMERYGPANSDFKLLMKANVFAQREDYEAYNEKAEIGVSGFARAYYSPMEPRFITSYDGGDDEDDAYADQVQCHEATHQLVHFYTWDLTRKDLGRDPDWLEVAYRPLWSGEGFAEFFSSHRVVDGKYVWMQPLDERLRHIWIFGEMAKEKGWTPWRLREFFFTLHHAGHLTRLASARATKSGDEAIAEGAMANLFYAKAWSFVHFLWYADAGGKPKYRDGYIAYLRSEFHVRFQPDQEGKPEPHPVGSGSPLRHLRVEGDEQLAALEREWQEYEGKLVEANRKPAWDAERAKLRKMYGFDAPEKGTK